MAPFAVVASERVGQATEGQYLGAAEKRLAVTIVSLAGTMVVAKQVGKGLRSQRFVVAVGLRPCFHGLAI